MDFSHLTLAQAAHAPARPKSLYNEPGRTRLYTLQMHFWIAVQAQMRGTRPTSLEGFAVRSAGSGHSLVRRLPLTTSAYAAPVETSSHPMPVKVW